MGIAEEIEKLKNDTVAVQEAEAKAEREQREKLEALRARIKAGESTGDRLRDFALACWNDDLNGLTARVFHGIQEQLHGKIGQLAMIVEYRSVRSGFGSQCFEEVESMKIGFLSDDQLSIDLRSGAWGLPCLTHVVYGKVSGLVPGWICFNDEHTTLEYGAVQLGMGHPDRTPDIIVGDQEVTERLAYWQAMPLLQGKVADLMRKHLVILTLELRVPEGHRLEQERLTLRDESFHDALNLERFIAEKRFIIENDPRLAMAGIEAIRAFITSLGEKIDLAVKLGIDPNRPEILRMRENFGRYWKT